MAQESLTAGEQNSVLVNDCDMPSVEHFGCRSQLGCLTQALSVVSNLSMYPGMNVAGFGLDRP